MVKYRPPAGATQRARRLRKNPTDAEKAMWNLLRENFPEARFRRQVPLRNFTADFASHGVRLVVEVDGGQHGDGCDIERTRVIEAEGYRVIRFWNNNVLGNRDGVAISISETLLQLSPPPNPPPSRGRA